MSKKVVVIGSGFSGLSAACFLAKDGYDVTLLEKNDSIGGRARKFAEDGFTFDMGPSWYWMPEVFENFYNHFGKTASDFYNLKRLDPSYQVFFKDGERKKIPAGRDAVLEMVETMESGAGKKLGRFLDEA